MKRLVMALFAGAATLSAGVTSAHADAARGREVYTKVGCYQCHGFEGQGANTGPRIGPEPMEVEALKSFLRNASATAMPPYSEKLVSDGDVADIHAFLASVKKPPAAKDIPLLNNR